MTQIQQGEITVAAAALLGVVYWGLCMIKHKDCDSKQLAYFAGEIVGLVTGVFTVLSVHDVMKVSVQSGIVCGIAGVIIALATLTDVVKRFRDIVRKDVQPTRIEAAGS